MIGIVSCGLFAPLQEEDAARFGVFGEEGLDDFGAVGGVECHGDAVGFEALGVVLGHGGGLAVYWKLEEVCVKIIKA